MGSSSLNREELVRQRLIRRLVETLGYPASLIVVEKKLSELPNIAVTGILPNRRIDLLIYSPAGYPLVLIECKVKRITPQAIRQVLGYNAFIKARVAALVSESEEICMVDGKSVSCLPCWKGLVG